MTIRGGGLDGTGPGAVVQARLVSALCKAALARNRTRAQRSRSTSVASSPQRHRAASQRRSSGSSQSAILPEAASRAGSVGVGVDVPAGVDRQDLLAGAIGFGC